MLALLAWTWVEFTLVSVFLIALAIATSFDRSKGSTGPKYGVALVGIIAFIIYLRTVGEASKLNTLDYWKSLEPFAVLGRYMMVGFVYAILEALYDVMARRKELKFAWAKFLTSCPKGSMTHENVRRWCFEQNDATSIVDVVVPNRQLVPSPQINLVRLREFMFAWAFFWPGYALSLIFGRLIDAFWDVVIDFFGKAIQRFTNLLFRNTFSN